VNNHVPLNVMVSRELADDLQRYCSKHQMKKAHVVRRAIESWLKRDNGANNSVTADGVDIQGGAE
jgi:hypothetical protein